MLLSRKHIPSSRIYPLQFRKIWKKLITLEIGRGKGARKMWRSILGSLLSVLGIYILLGITIFDPSEINVIVFLAPILIMFLSLIFILAIYIWLYVWTYYYDLGENYIRIRKGVLIRREVTVPYNRIHDVYLDQDTMDHIFHLYDLYVATASEISYRETHIDGLNRHNALKMRDLLMEKVKKFGPAGRRQNSTI